MSVNIAGLSREVTANWSDATPAYRTTLKTNIVNGDTYIEVKPNGTSVVSKVNLANNSDNNNCGISALGISSTVAYLRSENRGTGTLLPLELQIGSQSAHKVATNGQQSSCIPGTLGTLYPEFKCRAWVNFNGTGTVAIRGSGNVSTIGDNGTGNYTVNLTTAMPDVNYCANVSAKILTSWLDSGNSTVTYSLSSFQFLHNEGNGGVSADSDVFNVSIFR